MKIPRILLAQRAPVEGYPPVLHQASILRAEGQVTILDSTYAEAGASLLTAHDVARISVSMGSRSGSSLGRLSRVRAASRFRNAFTREILRDSDVVIAFEPEAAAILLQARKPSAREPLKIIHLHEHPTKDAYAGSVFGRRALSTTLSRLATADLVVVADSYRAQKLAELASLSPMPTVVMNCPMRLTNLPESRLIPVARARGVSGPVIHYHGAVGTDHGLEATIESMKWWPENSSFFIVGGGSDEYVASLKHIASAIGVESRLVFVGRVPYDEVFSFAVGATIGISMLDTSKPNWQYAAGASNKRFEYMALGIPQITSAGPGVSELFQNTGAALLADPDNPRSIAQSINRYIDSPELRGTASASARALHLSQLNYEFQFQPVLDRIRQRLKAGRN